MKVTYILLYKSLTSSLSHLSTQNNNPAEHWETPPNLNHSTWKCLWMFEKFTVKISVWDLVSKINHSMTLKENGGGGSWKRNTTEFNAAQEMGLGITRDYTKLNSNTTFLCVFFVCVCGLFFFSHQN